VDGAQVAGRVVGCEVVGERVVWPSWLAAYGGNGLLVLGPVPHS
jgi:hypothetical protein